MEKGSEIEAGTLDLFPSSAENELLETQKLSDKLLLENLVEKLVYGSILVASTCLLISSSLQDIHLG